VSVGNTVYVRVNGPLIIKGDVVVQDVDGTVLLEENEAYLCRCGLSNNKPFCDGEHKRCAFTDPAMFKDEKGETLVIDESQKLVISVRPHAMLIVKGPMTIQNEDASSITTRNKAALCCCGLSKNKPFCDVSHKAN